MDWRISGRRKVCAACGAQFEPNARVVSAIFDKGGEFLRQDCCAACWKPCDDAFSFWQHTVETPDEPRLADRSALMGLFRNLSGADQERKRDFRYVLALALMRRRALKPLSSRTKDEREIMVLRHPPDESLHEVEVRPITADRVQAMMSEVTRVIHVPGEDAAKAQPEAPFEENAQ